MYMKDTCNLIKYFRKLGNIKKNKFLYIANIIIICSNFDMEEGIVALKISFNTKLLYFDSN